MAEFGSFIRAAERLHAAQPALSLLLRQLEEELGTRLLDCTTQHVPGEMPRAVSTIADGALSAAGALR